MRMRRVLGVLLVLTIAAAAGAYFFIRASLGSDLVRTTIEQQLAARLNQPVRIRSAGATFFPRLTIDLSDVSIGSPEAIRLGSIQVGVGIRDLLSRAIADATVIVTDGRVTLPLPFPLLTATQDASAAPTSTTITVTSVRVIAVRGLVLAGSNRTLRIDLEAALDGDRLDVARLAARADRTQIQATGTVNSVAKLEGQFEASANPLDLDELIALTSAFTAPAATAGSTQAAAVPMHVAVKLTSPVGRFAGYDFTDLSSTIDVTPTHLQLAPLTLRAFGGTFAGRLNVDGRGRTSQLRLGGQVGGLDVAALLKASGSPGGITGTLGGTVALNGEGSDTQTLLRESRGTITAAITDGAIPHLEMARAIVLAFGKPSGAPPEGSGSAFSKLGGTFALKEGTLSSADLSMSSRDFDLAGSGSLSITTGAVDARTDVVLSEELTAQAGTDLRRYAQEGKQVIVPARISGTLQAPTVSIDVVAATRRAIGNELKRRATDFLEGIFRKRKQ